MSQTPTVGIMTAEYMTYAAAVTAERLQEIVKTKQVTLNATPKGVVNDLIRFFKLALDAHSHPPDNPQASMQAYILATNILEYVAPKLREVNSVVTYENAYNIRDLHLQFLLLTLKTTALPCTLQKAELPSFEFLLRFTKILTEVGEGNLTLDRH